MIHRINTTQQTVIHQYQTQKQKAVTPYRQKTLNSHHFRTMQHTLQDHQPAANKKATQRNSTHPNISQSVPSSYTSSLQPYQEMKPPQHLPQTSSDQMQINENSQINLILTQHRLENHHFYQHHQHHREYPTTQTTINNAFQDHPHSAAENQPLQDHQSSPTTDFTNNTFQDHHHHHLDTTHTQPFQDQQTITVTIYSHTFQDYILQIYRTCTKNSSQDHSTINRHHYYHYQHLQDHTNRYLDTFRNKYIMYQSYYHTCYNITPDEERNQKIQVNIKNIS